MLLRFMPLILVSFSELAGELDDKNLIKEQETINFCLDKQSALDNEQLAHETPNDVQLIRLVAIRAGLCDLISKNIIELEFAIDLFNSEHAKGVRERIQEEQTSNREIGA